MNKSIEGEAPKPSHKKKVVPQTASINEWDDFLTAEGMPPELPYNIVFPPSLDAKYQRTVDNFWNSQGKAPTINAVIDRLPTEDAKQVVLQFGERVQVNVEELPAQGEPFEDTVDRRVTVESALRRLPDERQVDIVIRRFGLGDDPPQSLDAMGDFYRLSRERISKIISRATSTILKDKDGPLYDWETPSDKDASNEPVKINEDLLNPPKVPLIDFQDERPYLERLSEINGTWLDERKEYLENLRDKEYRFLSSFRGDIAKLCNASELSFSALSKTYRDFLDTRKDLFAERTDVQDRTFRDPIVQQSRLLILDTKIEALAVNLSILKVYARNYYGNDFL